jgi:hypothetical protein
MTTCQENEQLDKIMNNEEYTFFFKFNKEYYASSEEGRLMFAYIKTPDKDDKKWVKEATFTAMNISKAMKGEESERMFSSQDVPNIDVIDKEKVKKVARK